jgi:hypothetical protein
MRRIVAVMMIVCAGCLMFASGAVWAHGGHPAPAATQAPAHSHDSAPAGEAPPYTVGISPPGGSQEPASLGIDVLAPGAVLETGMKSGEVRAGHEEHKMPPIRIAAHEWNSSSRSGYILAAGFTAMVFLAFGFFCVVRPCE